MIGFRISGTKERRAGFTPLITAGVLAGGEGDNMDRTTLVNEKPTYVLKQTGDYILYLLIDQRVKAFDTDASGVLSFALTIPSGQQLAGGKSPYEILHDTYKTFLELYTTQMNDGRNEFKNVEYDQNVFRDIINGYSLEPRLTPTYVKMNPTGLSGVLCVPTEDLNDFFKNTQYPEFEQFREIQIGSHCSSQVTPGLTDLKIPMPAIQYRVKVNGKDAGKKLIFPEDSFTAIERASNPDSGYFMPINFTLQEVLTAPNGILKKDEAVIRLNKTNATIDCTLKFIPYMYKLVYDGNRMTGNISVAEIEDINRAVASGKIRIMLGSRDITDMINFGGGEEEYSKLERATITVNPQNYKGMQIRVNHGFSPDKEYLIAFEVRKGKAIVAPVTTVNDKLSTTHRIKVGKNTSELSSNIAKSPQDKPQKKNFMPLIISFLAGLVVGGFLTYLIFGGEEAALPKQPNPDPGVYGPGNDPSDVNKNQDQELISGNTVKVNDQNDEADSDELTEQASDTNPAETVKGDKPSLEAGETVSKPSEVSAINNNSNTPNYNDSLVNKVNDQIKTIDWTNGDDRNNAILAIRHFWDRKDPKTGKKIKEILDADKRPVTNSVERLFEIPKNNQAYVVKQLKDRDKRSFSSVDEIIKFKGEIYTQNESD